MFQTMDLTLCFGRRFKSKSTPSFWKIKFCLALFSSKSRENSFLETVVFCASSFYIFCPIFSSERVDCRILFGEEAEKRLDGGTIMLMFQTIYHKKNVIFIEPGQFSQCFKCQDSFAKNI